MRTLVSLALMALAVVSATEVGAKGVDGLEGLDVSSLTVNAPEGQAARVTLGSGTSRYSFGVHADGKFAISRNAAKDVITVNQDGDVTARTELLAAGALASANGFIVDSVRQWALWRSEDFSGVVEGWTSADGDASSAVTTCGGVTMLGGYEKSSKTVLSKTFKGLPEHSRLRIKATYHFIDLWQGEVGYMQTNSGAEGAMEYAWMDRYELPDSKGLINVCGNEQYSEGRFSVPIDVTLVHTGDEVTIAFGSTLTGEPTLSSFGVSSVELYVRRV